MWGGFGSFGGWVGFVREGVEVWSEIWYNISSILEKAETSRDGQAL